MAAYNISEKITIPFESVDLDLFSLNGNNIKYKGDKSLFIKSPQLIKKLGPRDDKFGQKYITYSFQTNEKFQQFIIDLENKILSLMIVKPTTPYKQLLNEYNGELQLPIKIKRDTITDGLQSARHTIVFNIVGLWDFAGKNGITLKCTEIYN